jgi:hypothetical protein
VNTGDGIQIGVGVVLALTLLAVCWYAWEARKQAKASTMMAGEMREQRLDADRPYVLIEVLGLKHLEWQEVKLGEDAEPDPLAAYPKAVGCRIYNAGRAPAKEIAVTLLQSRVAFETQKKDVLEPGEHWDTRVQATPLVGHVHEVLTGEKAVGMEGWMRRQGIDSRCYGDRYDCGLVVLYTDIRDRGWATYSKFSLILSEVSTMGRGKPVTERVLVPVEHRIVQVGGAQ